LAEYRNVSLRKILAAAKERSPWHRRRLSHINPQTVTEAELATIPTMSKDDLMSNFDDILTDRRLSRELVEAHIAGLNDDCYLLDEFHALASGGSSGTRGEFVYGWEEWAKVAILSRRFRIRYEWSHSDIGRGATRAIVAAGKASHVSYAVSRTFREIDHATPISAALRVSEIVDRLNRLQPAILQGYPSILYSLAREASAQRLQIEPRMIVTIAEPLLPEMRRAMEDAVKV
jgi:phenylacetate-coenzyme A ligase PaaK-like adenylate-forming protein